MVYRQQKSSSPEEPVKKVYVVDDSGRRRGTRPFEGSWRRALDTQSYPSRGKATWYPGATIEDLDRAAAEAAKD